jgi:hypothetical protein
MGYLYAAIELLDSQIKRVEEQPAVRCPLARQPLNPCKLQWTGTQVEFVELIYALHKAKSINNGDIFLKDLFTELGEVFNFRVTDYYRFFGDITHRTGDRTLFMDKLKKALMQHLSELDTRQR